MFSYPSNCQDTALLNSCFTTYDNLSNCTSVAPFTSNCEIPAFSLSSYTNCNSGGLEPPHKLPLPDAHWNLAPSKHRLSPITPIIKTDIKSLQNTKLERRKSLGHHTPFNHNECPPPMLTANGKRRGRKPGINSTLAQRSAANSRERSRMRVLSSAFIDLKGALPWVPHDTKLSKLDTLKLAAGYISYLKGVLDAADDQEDVTAFLQSTVSCTSTPSALSVVLGNDVYNHTSSTTLRHPVTYTWPYNLNKSNCTSIVKKTSTSPNQTPNKPTYNDKCRKHAPRITKSSNYLLT